MRARGRPAAAAGAAGARRFVLGACLVGAGAAFACGPSRPAAPPVPAPTLNWPAALGDAQRAATAGRFADADRLLAAFATAYADSPEAIEVRYWQALFKLDPANREGSARRAVADLDAYLANTGLLQHRVEGDALRRVAALVDTLRTAAEAPQVTVAVPTAAEIAATKAKDDEILRLRDSLTKTSAELERVRKRLAPRP